MFRETSTTITAVAARFRGVIECSFVTEHSVLQQQHWLPFPSNFYVCNNRRMYAFFVSANIMEKKNIIFTELYNVAGYFESIVYKNIRYKLHSVYV